MALGIQPQQSLIPLPAGGWGGEGGGGAKLRRLGEQQVSAPGDPPLLTSSSPLHHGADQAWWQDQAHVRNVSWKVPAPPFLLTSGPGYLASYPLTSANRCGTG